MSRQISAWLSRRPAWFLDVVLALFVTAVQLQSAGYAMGAEPVSRPVSDLANTGYVLLAISGLSVAARRRLPVTVFAITSLASLVYFALGYPDRLACLALFIAIYTLAAHGGRRSLLIAGVGTGVTSLGWLIAAADINPPAAIGWVFFRIGAAVISMTLGVSIHSRRVIAADAQRRAELAERSREEEARARVNAERLRIAREVHDTVASAIAIINVQAGVTAHVLDKRPEQAREALSTIEETSSRALREMRAILGVLRDGDDREPYPGLDQIHELTTKARDAGLEIALRQTEPETPLPSAVGSAAYRIVQESITNVIRHVGPTKVTVALEPGVDALRIRVTDDGGRGPRVASAVDAPTSGRGIVGMRERCRLLGGELDAKSRPGGGFEVTARLPLAPVGSRL
ncbi:Signal transduction histidine kinase [Actinokineospora alba]|uniref:histidine kinase n=2 Tax=Actinokineospora alba TaxID=504798 RepID=A0A1H0FXI8_9PSEU|nr:signal transduction histidine kinase [Actinokineospora alba]SDI11677.1 Signal transduction histidine kinase [Actinokineospora alba]SDN99292.1 Signal transduction histidine kinase [Actinokineospora alba]